MLQHVTWRLGLNEKPTDYICPIFLFQDEEGILWLKWIDDEAIKGAEERGDDSDRFPICLPMARLGCYESTFNLEHFLIPDLCNVRVIPRYYGPSVEDGTDESWDRWHEWLDSRTEEYGVADNLQQVLAHFDAEIQDREHRYVLEMSEVVRADQPEHGGWRWHKWGTYIGAYDITTEYLYDDPTIDRVWCFSIHEVEVLS